MGSVRNGRVLFNSIPTGYPEPGKTVIYDDSETIELDNVGLNGGFLIKTLYLSIDPYFRERMRDASAQSFLPAYTIGRPLAGWGIGIVLRSEYSGVKPGDHIYGVLKHQQYTVYSNLEKKIVIHNKYNLPLSAFVGPVGVPGKAAFMGWKKYSHAKKGQIVFVSGGGGPVGSLVIQFAKMDGMKVIASAGSEDKVNFMKKVGADVAFNYKTTDTSEVLRKEGPIDIYWDNVGGDTLSAALEAASIGARFIICGMISGYNTGGAPVRNMDNIYAKAITMNGFIATWLAPELDKEFYEVMPKAVVEGAIQWREEIWDGLAEVGNAILAVQKGENKAKVVVKVATM